MANFLSSSVQVIEEEPSVRGVPQVPTAIPAFVGLTERGPLDTPTVVTSNEQFTRTFGGFVSGQEVALAVRQFFLNGGQQAVIVRILGASGSAVATVDLDNATVATLQVDATSAGVWGNSLSVEVVAATNGDADYFNLNVYLSGVLVEQWPNLIMEPDTSPDYAETIINDSTTGSLYIRVTDQDAGGTAALQRPVNVSATALTTGSDGVAVVDADFTGGTDPNKGINSLEAEQITLLAIPDQPTTGVQNAMVTFCEVTRNLEVFAVMDPPDNSTSTAIRTHKGTLTSSEVYSLYWPQVKIPNPNTAVFGSGELITVAPSGTICGLMARNDAAQLAGPFVQPAGIENGRMLGVVDVERAEVLRKSERDLVYPDRINPITFLSGVGIFVDGSRTGKGNGNFPSVGERRGVSFVEVTLKAAFQFARHRNNTPELRGLLERTGRGFLFEQTKNGAFASAVQSEAFTIDADIQGSGLNDASTRAQGKVFIRIGLATAKPAEFIVLLVSQDTRALQEATSGRQ